MSGAAQLSPGQRRAQDVEHLRVLALSWKVVAALLCGLRVLLSLPFLAGAIRAAGDPVYFLLSSGFVLALIGVPGVLLAASAFLVSKDLELRRNRDRCIVLSVLICFAPPVGLILGVVTIAVLSRVSVREMFDV